MAFKDFMKSKEPYLSPYEKENMDSGKNEMTFARAVEKETPLPSAQSFKSEIPAQEAAASQETEPQGHHRANKRIEEDIILEPIPSPPSPRKPPKKEAQEMFEGPLGIDIGTTNIVLAQKEDNHIKISLQLNAFVTMPYSSLTKEALLKNEIFFFISDHTLYVMGHSAEDFADIFGGHVRRPIESGILNPKENEAENVIKAFIEQLLRPPKKRGEKAYFSVPGKSLDGTGSSLTYHESVLKSHLASLGYAPVAINEGSAVVISELSGNNYTGIGISLGGGMCNICFSYLTVPVISYSVPKGGDYIDTMAARAAGESQIKVKGIKENELNLLASPKDRIETALHVYYGDLFAILANSLQNVLGTSASLPRLSKPIPIVLSGGTILPPGSHEMFLKAMKGIRLPFKISEVLVAKNPLYATAKGALTMALLEE